jgi:hypothetical protein
MSLLIATHLQKHLRVFWLERRPVTAEAKPAPPFRGGSSVNEKLAMMNP